MTLQFCPEHIKEITLHFLKIEFMKVLMIAQHDIMYAIHHSARP